MRGEERGGSTPTGQVLSVTETLGRDRRLVEHQLGGKIASDKYRSGNFEERGGRRIVPHQNVSIKIFGINRGSKICRKGRNRVNRPRTSRCIDACHLEVVNHLISYLSTQARGVSAHGSSTCGATCRSTRCRCICNRSMLIDMWVVWCRSACNQPTNQTCGGVILHDILILLTTMWSTRCRRACNRSHAERHAGCHQPEVTTPVLSHRLEEFLFEFRVVQRMTFRVRHAFAVSWERRLLEQFKKGFWSRIRARDQSHNEPNTVAWLVSECEPLDNIARLWIDRDCDDVIGWILGTRDYCQAVTIACLISNARMIRGKESCISMSLRGLAERLHKPVCLCGCELGIPGRECEEKAGVGCVVYKCRVVSTGKSRVMIIIVVMLFLGELLVLDCLGLEWRGVVFVSWGPGILSDTRLLIKLTYCCRKPLWETGLRGSWTLGAPKVLVPFLL
ncbi:hypothetical protein F2Q69_00042488 [Brassica cretica]|uniref:Uncharacterized protein n=1 Tax=Brassica cretica TaxID=69181 RepID=A0A8S9NJW0_BRACR|nr:hypothetical protein F2Q69_00042488 [Brassica cretica]